jgi:hypothetical protein
MLARRKAVERRAAIFSVTAASKFCDTPREGQNSDGGLEQFRLSGWSSSSHWLTVLNRPNGTELL